MNFIFSDTSWMNERNSTIDLPNSFQPEIRQGRVAGKSFKKIRYRPDCLLIRAILMVKKYMHENVKHIVTKHLPKKSIHSFRQLLPTIANMFQISYQAMLTLWWSYSQTILHTFSDIKQCWRFQRVPGKQYYSVYIKQYWHF